MRNKDHTFSATCILASVFILSQLLAALVLYKERLFIDASYYFFHVVNEETFRIEHQRLILAVSQFPLLIGVKSHLSLHSLLIIYSVTPVLYTALLLFIVLYFFRSVSGAWMIIFCSTCGSYFLYFCPMYEVSYATVLFGFLWFLTEQKYYQGYRQVLIYTLLLSLSLFGYPIIALGCLALISYLLVFDRRLDKNIILIYAFIVVVWCIVKYFFISDYERGNVTLPPGKTHEILAAIFSFQYLIGLIKLMLTSYLSISIAAIIFVIWSIVNKKYAEVLWSVFWLATILIIVNVKSHAYMVNTIHNERSYLILVPICFAPLLFRLYPSLGIGMRSLFIFLFMISSAYESARIWKHSAIFTQRLHQLDQIAIDRQAKGCAAAAISFYQLPEGLNEWSSGMEEFIFSSERGKSIILSDIEMYNAMNAIQPIDKKHLLLRTDEVISKDSLNHFYFNLDTTQTYCY